MPRHYITTAIDYPNAPPHMGHVLEKVLADVCARWMRIRGDDVRFQIGTDEHGVKNQRAAAVKGITPKELVDGNVPLFKELYKDLNISHDFFIRTTDRKLHWPTVIALWKKLHEGNMLEKREYSGLYCSGCEHFVTNRDLIGGKCPLHQMEPEKVTEENWFFLLSKESTWLKELLIKGDGGYTIVPKFRAQETLSLIDRGLEDISFSRPKSSLAWGIPVPGDEEQTMYVWCDALTNYISPLGILTEREDQTYWENAEITHVIGKDIARFHALYWPAMLKYAGVKTPNRLLIHGFITSEGQKMSKSLGNVVAPKDVIKKYGVDALRFYLSHEIPVGRDGDFSWKKISEIYNAKLRNDIGNLLNRVITIIRKDGGAVTVPQSQDIIGDTWDAYRQAMNRFELSIALKSVCMLASKCNVYIDEHKPWSLEEKNRKNVLGTLAENLRHIALMLLPFIPGTSVEISRQLGIPYAGSMNEKRFTIGDKIKWGSQRDWKCTGKAAILFPQVK